MQGSASNQQLLSSQDQEMVKQKQIEEMRNRPRVKLDFLNAFGMTTGSYLHDIQNCLNFLEEADSNRLVLAYPVGKHIGVRDIKTNEMKFIRQSDNLKEITALSLSPNKKFLAVCEVQKDDKAAFITFYDMKSPFYKNIKSHINVCEQQTPTNQKIITSIAFSDDSKYVVCLLNVPDCRALAYDWYQKNRVISSFDFFKQEVTKISFHPKDNHKVCTSGQNNFQLWSMQEDTFKALNEFKGLPKSAKSDEPLFFSDHAWTIDDDFLIGCSRTGDLFAIDTFEVFQIISQDPKNKFSCLIAFPGGFCAATEDGIIHFYKLYPEKKRFILVNKWSCEDLKNEKIVAMTCHEINKTEIYLAISSKNRNIVYLNIMKQIYNENENEMAILGGHGGSASFADQSASQYQATNIIGLSGGTLSNSDINYDIVAKGFHSGAITCMDISIQRPLIVTGSKDDTTVRLWNYYTGQCELSREFMIRDKDNQSVRDQTKQLLAVAMHPSGYYMAVGFSDKVHIVHILHDELRNFRLLEIKNCSGMKFSNGGHYFVVADQKQIHIYASYTLEHLCKWKCPSQNISCINFNERDTCMVVVCSDGFLQRYDLTNFQKKGDGSIDRNCDFKGCVFVEDDPKDELRVVAVGSEHQKSLFRVYNQKEDVELSVQAPQNRKFTQVCLLRSFNNGIQSLIVGTDKGTLKVFGMPPHLQPYLSLDSFNCHLGEVTRILTSPDGRFVFSAGTDGTLFVYSVTEYASEGVIFKQGDITNVAAAAKDEIAQSQMQAQMSVTSGQLDTPAPVNAQLSLVVDEHLAHIVMVQKQVMENWRKQQELLKQEMEEENNKVESSLRHEKYKYEQSITLMEKTKTDQLNDLNKRYEDLQGQEAEQKDENTQTMKKMELNHLQCMEELQTLYEKKLALENQGYTKLEKEKGEMRSRFEGEIKLLQRQNEEAIEKLLTEFKTNLQKVQDEYEDSKRTADGLKMMYEEKLTQQEDEHEAEVGDFKSNNKMEREQLEDVIGTLKNDIETIKRQIRRIRDERDQFDNLKDKASKKKKHLKDILEEKKAIISQLEQEKREVQEKLKKKETDLYKYKFKIKDLQKTKQVLTHRTQEMKSSLEPKEQQIENLKEQLLDLEKVFEKQSKAMQNLKEDVDRRQDKIKELQDSVVKEKNSTKTQEKTIQAFVNEIHRIVQQKDEKSYITGLMHIYNHYVKQYSDEILEKKKKDPETIEELDRQLRYMEKSVSTLKSNTSKNDTRTKSNIKKKTRENTELILELNELRMRKKELEKDIDDKDLTISQLSLEKKRRMRELEKKHGSSSQIHQSHMNNPNRGESSEMAGGVQSQYYSRPKSGQMRSEEYQSNQSNQVNKLKGKIYKGTPYNYLKGGVEDKAKVQDLTAQLEDNNQQILLQKLEVRSLKDQIIRLLEERRLTHHAGGIEEEEGMDESKLQSLRSNLSPQGGNKLIQGGGATANVVRIAGSGPGNQSNLKQGFLPRVDSRSNL